jgi:hypothetical protein
MKVSIVEANGGGGGSLFAIFLLGGVAAVLIPWVVANATA